jgi:hypothetical protein
MIAQNRSIPTVATTIVTRWSRSRRCVGVAARRTSRNSRPADPSTRSGTGQSSRARRTSVKLSPVGRVLDPHQFAMRLRTPLTYVEVSVSGLSGCSPVDATDVLCACLRRVVGMDLIVLLLVVLIVLALVGSIAVSPLLWVLVIILVLFAFFGRGRYYGR